MSSPTNPYIAGNPVTGTEMFFGRQDVFRFVRETLVGRYQDNAIVLYGGRRTGKTSVLYQMGRHLDPRYVPVFVDLQGISLEGLGEMLWGIARQATRALRRQKGIRLTIPSRDAFAGDPGGCFREGFLDPALEALGDDRLLVMLDEAARLYEQVQAGRLEPRVFDLLRSLIQYHPHLNFVFSIGSGLEEMCQEYAVLFNLCQYRKISFLDRDAVEALIIEPVEEHYRYAPGAVEHILEVTHGQPYYTQLVCNRLFARWARQRGDVVTVSDVEAALGEAVEQGMASLQYTWEEASNRAKVVLAALVELMVDGNQPISTNDLRATIAAQEISLSRRAVSGALQELVTREVLRPTNGGYVFTVDLMRLWVQQYQRLEWVVGKISLPEEARPPVRRSWVVVGVAVAGLVLLTLFVIAWPNIRRWSAIIAPSETAISAEVQATQPTPTATPTTTTTPSAPTSEDNYESNDNFDEAYTLPVATSVTLENLEGVTNFYPSGDEDWFKFLAKAGHWYQATTSELDGVDTYVEICDQNNSVMKRDDDGGGGYASQVKWEAQYDGYYYIRIININKVDTIGEYDLTVKEISAPATVTPRPSPTPDPDFDIAADSCEDNSDFDHACVIPPDAYYHFNFVPPYGGMDNDFFKLWVKPGLIYQCATSNLDYGVDPNMIMFSGPSWDDAVVSNDDFEPGNFNSRLAYYATYEDWLYLLVETGDRTPSDIYNSHYGLRCDMLLPPQPTATPTQPIPPPTPTFTPFSPSLGDAWIRPADGMVMVYAPGGTFQMGSDVSDPYAEGDEFPQHSVSLDGFWIDQTEVTNAQFATFLNERGNQTESGAASLDLEDVDCLIEWVGEYRPRSGYADHPVVEVSSYGAVAYCEWAGGRLPTEAEWEYAARGSQGLAYPWGDILDCSRANFDDETQDDDDVVPGGEGCDGYDRTAPVGSFPAGASWCGALDMAGNVWEWTADRYGSDYYGYSPSQNPTGPSSGEHRVIRGGSWGNGPDYVRSANRGYRLLDFTGISIGLRCARGSE